MIFDVLVLLYSSCSLGAGVSIKFSKFVGKSSDNKIYKIATFVTYLVTYMLELSLMYVMVINVIALSMHFQDILCDQTPASDWLNKMDTPVVQLFILNLCTHPSITLICICRNESPDIYHRYFTAEWFIEYSFYSLFAMWMLLINTKD